MTRTRRIVAGAALVVLVVAFAVWWVLGPGRTVRSSTRHDAVASASTADESAQIEAVDTLVRRLPEAFAAGDATVLSAAAGERGADLSQALPTGAQLTMDRSTWRRTGSVGSATVTMIMAGQPPVRFVLVVVREDGAWRVSSTYEVTA